MKHSLPPKTLLLPSTVLIIGTYGSDGKPNMMNAAWGGIASSKPHGCRQIGFELKQK